MYRLKQELQSQGYTGDALREAMRFILNREDFTVHLQNKTSLYLYNCELTELPEWIGKLVKLKSLSLWENNLTQLPESFGNLVKLKELDLYSNDLTDLPDSIGKLVNLESLDLRGNNLTQLPEWIGSLVKLKELELSGNDFSKQYKSHLKADLKTNLPNCNVHI